jgi:hypothetical protein
MRATSEARVLGDIVGAGVKEKEVMGLTGFLFAISGLFVPSNVFRCNISFVCHEIKRSHGSQGFKDGVRAQFRFWGLEEVILEVYIFMNHEDVIFGLFAYA